MRLHSQEFRHLAVIGAVIDRKLAGIRLLAQRIGDNTAGIIALDGGTLSARAGPHTSIPQTAIRLAAPIIRIADSISLTAP